MQEFKGTKGPWKIKAQIGLQIIGSVITKQGYTPYSPGICNLDFNNTGVYVSMPLAEREANAKLISAAPELLEACLATLDAQTNKEIESAKGLCYAAITKALTI